MKVERGAGTRPRRCLEAAVQSLVRFYLLSVLSGEVRSSSHFGKVIVFCLEKETTYESCIKPDQTQQHFL